LKHRWTEINTAFPALFKFWPKYHLIPVKLSLKINGILYFMKTVACHLTMSMNTVFAFILFTYLPENQI